MPDSADYVAVEKQRLWGWKHLFANTVERESGIFVPCQGPYALVLPNNSLGDAPCCADCGGPLRRVVEPVPDEQFDGEAGG